MKTAEELKSHFIKNYAPSMLDKKNDVSFVIDLDDLIESYARTHAIEFAIDYEDMDFELAPIETFDDPQEWHRIHKEKIAECYDEWIESKE